MTHFIALIHKEPDSSYGVSFPDVPGVTAAADSLDAALDNGADALSFAAEDWEQHIGTPFPQPRSLDSLQADPDFAIELRQGAVAAGIPFRAPQKATA